MRLEEDRGILDREEGKEACHSQAAAERNRPYHRIQEQRRDYLGNHEVRRDLGIEPVAGIGAAAGREGSHREGEGKAAAAAHGIEAAVG